MCQKEKKKLSLIIFNKNVLNFLFYIELFRNINVLYY